MNLTDSTWSPFQSPEVRDICEHLTPEERARVLDDARQRGQQLAQRIAVPLSIAVGSFMWSWHTGLVLLVLFVLYMGFSGLPLLQAMRTRSKELLCETAWARSRGYTPEGLRLMTPPWER